MVNLKRTQVLTSVRTLVALTGFTKHRVEKALKRLVKLKLIQREKCEEMQGLSRNDGEVITVLRLAGYPKLPDTSPATKSDVISNSSSKTKADGFVLPTELDTPSMQEAWGDFITHRKQKQKGLTERSAKLVLNKLVVAKLTPDEAVTELNKAIECGWTSVFPKKEDTSIKAVKRTRKSSYTPAGPEALIASDTAALGMRAA